jgi:hypothetical protein
MYYHNYPAFDGGLGFRFRPFKALKRAATITKTSFQPKKIFGAIGSLVAGTATFGLGPMLAPKVFSANSKTMKSLGMAVSAIALVAGAVVLGPAIAGALGPMMSSAAGMAGKAVGGMQVFTKAFNMLSPRKREQLATELTPQQIADVELGKAQLTEQGIDYSTYQAPGSLKVQGEMVPMGYGSEGGAAPQAVRQGASLGGIDPIYLIGGGALLFLMMKRN